VTRPLGKGEERTGFGGASFPFLADHFKDLNDLILHPRIVTACSELLGTDRLLLSQGEVWLKTGRSAEQKTALKEPLATSFYDNDDQRIHMDFPNHYLVHPPAFNEPDAVATIVYFEDARVSGGRTSVVPRNGESDEAYRFPYTKMPGFGMLPWINNRTLAERDLETRDPEVYSFRQKLYKREEYLDFRLGTILFYRLDLWHRGTPLLPGKSRAVANIIYKKESSAARITSWHVGWAANAYNAWTTKPPVPPGRGRFEVLLEGLEGWQRELLGFPRDDDRYWNRGTVEAVKARFPGIKGLPSKI
jgi:hypothetical protein